jgi:hypothetical protein
MIFLWNFLQVWRLSGSCCHSCSIFLASFSYGRNIYELKRGETSTAGPKWSLCLVTDSRGQGMIQCVEAQNVQEFDLKLHLSNWSIRTILRNYSYKLSSTVEIKVSIIDPIRHDTEMNGSGMSLIFLILINYIFWNNFVI